MFERSSRIQSLLQRLFKMENTSKVEAIPMDEDDQSQTTIPDSNPIVEGEVSCGDKPQSMDDKVERYVKSMAELLNPLMARLANFEKRLSDANRAKSGAKVEEATSAASVRGEFFAYFPSQT